MSTVFFPPTAPSPPANRIQVEGTPVAVLVSYPPWGGLRLHSLATPVPYRCGACERARESAMVATGEHMLVCPACFSCLARAAAVNIPEQRRPPEN